MMVGSCRCFGVLLGEEAGVGGGETAQGGRRLRVLFARGVVLTIRNQ